MTGTHTESIVIHNISLTPDEMYCRNNYPEEGMYRVKDKDGNVTYIAVAGVNAFVLGLGTSKILHSEFGYI